MKRKPWAKGGEDKENYDSKSSAAQPIGFDLVQKFNQEDDYVSDEDSPPAQTPQPSPKKASPKHVKSGSKTNHELSLAQLLFELEDDKLFGFGHDLISVMKWTFVVLRKILRQGWSLEALQLVAGGRNQLSFFTDEPKQFGDQFQRTGNYLSDRLYANSPIFSVLMMWEKSLIDLFRIVETPSCDLLQLRTIQQLTKQELPKKITLIHCGATLFFLYLPLGEHRLLYNLSADTSQNGTVFEAQMRRWSLTITSYPQGLEKNPDSDLQAKLFSGSNFNSMKAINGADAAFNRAGILVTKIAKLYCAQLFESMCIKLNNSYDSIIADSSLGIEESDFNMFKCYAAIYWLTYALTKVNNQLNFPQKINDHSADVQTLAKGWEVFSTNGLSLLLDRQKMLLKACNEDEESIKKQSLIFRIRQLEGQIVSLKTWVENLQLESSCLSQAPSASSSELMSLFTPKEKDSFNLKKSDDLVKLFADSIYIDASKIMLDIFTSVIYHEIRDHMLMAINRLFVQLSSIMKEPSFDNDLSYAGANVELNRYNIHLYFGNKRKPAEERMFKENFDKYRTLSLKAITDGDITVVSDNLTLKINVKDDKGKLVLREFTFDLIQQDAEQEERERSEKSGDKRDVHIVEGELCLNDVSLEDRKLLLRIMREKATEKAQNDQKKLRFIKLSRIVLELIDEYRNIFNHALGLFEQLNQADFSTSAIETLDENIIVVSFQAIDELRDGIVLVCHNYAKMLTKYLDLIVSHEGDQLSLNLEDAKLIRSEGKRKKKDRSSTPPQPTTEVTVAINAAVIKMKKFETNIRYWQHSIDFLNHMLECIDRNSVRSLLSDSKKPLLISAREKAAEKLQNLQEQQVKEERLELQLQKSR